jgi:phage FluMu protein Com
MAALFFICPKTRHKAPAGIETDAKSLQAAWTGTMKVDCPHCREVHDISMRDTYIERVAQDDSHRLYRFG